MKIALINPIPTLEENEQYYGQSWPPLGIILLGTILKNHGHQVRLLDQASNGFNFEKVQLWIRKIDPDVLGISAMTVGFLSAIQICQKAKEWNPNIITVLGHYLPTISPDRILKKYSNIVDYCVRGEDEYTLLKLIDHLESSNNNEPTEILGISYVTNGRIKHNLDCPLNKNLDELPFPDHSLINFPYRQNLAGIELMNSKFTSTFFTRGCPYSCTYCAVSSLSKRQYRTKSPERLVEEFLYLSSRKYTEVAFVDDNFSLNLKNVLRFCSLLKKENLDINWHVEMRVDNVSREFFENLVSAGCRSVNFGIESANQRILDYYNKKITPAQSLRAIKTAKQAKVDFVIGLFMLGAPYETLAECQNTVKFALNSGLDFFFLNIVETWPGIPMWDDLVSKGLINEENSWEVSTRVIDLTHTEQQRKWILSLIRQTYKEFFSFKRIDWIVKSFRDMLFSTYKRKILLDFMKHFISGMKTIVRLRNFKLSGFGKFSTED